MSEKPVAKALTETKVQLEQWDLKFGHLVVIKPPPEVTKHDDAYVTRLNNWWITQAPFFRGAKMMVINSAATLGVETDASLREIGYVRLDDSIGQLTVREILLNHAAQEGLVDEGMGVSVQGSHDPANGTGRQADRQPAASPS
jgi:1,2-phenylacetyl-CoA epoxidase catalytic subunit